MKTKTNSLLFLSFMGLIGLIGIQFYLVYNNYDLQEAAFLEEVKPKIRPILAEEREDEFEDVFLDRLQQHARKHIQENQSIENLSMLSQEFLDSLNQEHELFYKTYFNKKKFPHPIYLYKFLDDFHLIHESSTNKRKQQIAFTQLSLFADSTNTAGPFYRYADISSLESSFYIEDHSNAGTKLETVHIRAEVGNYFWIPNMKGIILNRMRSILLFAIASIIMVFAVFVYAIILFIKQKKISAVKTDFINNITHEFKTPLATLAVATKTLDSRKLEPNSVPFLNTVAVIKRQNKRLQGLMTQVVDAALSNKNLPLEKTAVPMEELLQTIIADFKLTCPKVEVIENYRTTNSVVGVSSFHWTSAIQNILENAAKYGANKVAIETFNEASFLVIKLIDNGNGISKKEQTKVFDKFYRVHKGDVHHAKGLGLGLYYTKKIVEAHEGTIALASKEKEGTSVTIKLSVK